MVRWIDDQIKRRVAIAIATAFEGSPARGGTTPAMAAEQADPGGPAAAMLDHVALDDSGLVLYLRPMRVTLLNSDLKVFVQILLDHALAKPLAFLRTDLIRDRALEAFNRDWEPATIHSLKLKLLRTLAMANISHLLVLESEGHEGYRLVLKGARSQSPELNTPPRGQSPREDGLK